MKFLTAGVVFLSMAAAMDRPASAAEKHAAHASAKNPGFEKIKALCGEWEADHSSSEHGMPGGSVTYRLTAGGNAVIETLFKGTEHEMVTMYYVDTDGGLCLTHYCVLGNRPHMRALPSSTPDTIVFKCRPEDNAAIESEVHMHQATFTFLDPDHVKSEWVLYRDGKADGAHGFTLTRKKK